MRPELTQGHTNMTENTPSLWLKRGEERRLRAGHLWIFGNEVDTARSALNELPPGTPVVIRTNAGKALGTGYANPHSLIAGRLISRDPERLLDESLLVHRLNLALAARRRHFASDHYRLIHGDADGLSGLVIDRYGDVCVVQPNTAGMELALDAIIRALQRAVAPSAILIRADSGLRVLEGLESYVRWAEGEPREFLELEENGCRFRVSATEGQKTGWYYDHRANRARLAPYVRGLRVLDVFSYVGGWGVQALAAGASAVTCIDSSAAALDRAQENAALNGVGEGLTAVEGDAFEALQALREERERYDVVILDPPAFVKRRKDLRNGLAGYRRLNQLAMQVLDKDGILVSASCSSHVSADELLKEVLGGARHLDRSLQIQEYGGHAPDHPEHPAIPETRYLKAWYCRVLPAWSTP